MGRMRNRAVDGVRRHRRKFSIDREKAIESTIEEMISIMNRLMILVRSDEDGLDSNEANRGNGSRDIPRATVARRYGRKDTEGQEG